MNKNLFVGLMSGTSLDGIDAVLVDFEHQPKLLAQQTYPIAGHIRQHILQCCTDKNVDLNQYAQLDRQLGHLFANAVNALLSTTSFTAQHICAIGSHGQTVRHYPDGKLGFSLQIGDANTIAANTNICTVADFRRRDIAVGGQGAPLVPAFHQAVFASTNVQRAIINIGGIANATLLPKNIQQPVLGFDTGPGNVLLDAWYQRHHPDGGHYDQDGRWGQTGQLSSRLLDQLLACHYFQRPIPKSTGRELFNIAWLESQLEQHGTLEAADVQQTLLHFTAKSIAEGLQQQSYTQCEIYLCGGGAHNHALRELIAYYTDNPTILTTAQLGIDVDWVEAVAFAWLARQTILHLPGNLPAVTGASSSVILGAIYPA